MNKIFEKLDKNKCYCKFCFFDKNTIKELNYTEDGLVELCEIHNYLKGNFHILVYKEKYDDFMDVRGRNPNKNPECEKKSAKTPGRCSIKMCGKYNKERDQNGRGRDIGYGIGKWIAENDILDELGNIIVHSGEECGCSCCKDWYTEHNNSKEMKEKSRESMNILIQRDDIFYKCPKCGYGKTSYLLTCPKCGYDPHDDFKFKCKNCGEPIQNPNSKCEKCGYQQIHIYKCKNCNKELNKSNIICPFCGFNNNINGVFNLYFCSECNKITPHDKNYNTCLVCSHEYTWCHRHERWETVDRQYLENKNKIISTFCPSCNLETPHKYNQKTRKLECQVCNGNLVYNFYINKFVTLENFEAIEQNKNQEKYYMYILENKGIDSTIGNIRRYKSLTKCNGLSFESFVNSLVWCPHCERWETPSFNSRPNHWMFWAAETKQWMDDNSEKVDLAKKIIIGLNNLLNSPVITGVYGWFINDKISYVGESMDILTRSWNHIMYIFEEPDYWYNIIDYFDKNKIEVKILESVDRNDQKYKNMTNKEFKSQVLKPLELKWINKLKPDSQRCDGTDHIRPIKERKIKINR